jgi:hypothetical protein
LSCFLDLLRRLLEAHIRAIDAGNLDRFLHRVAAERLAS